MFTNRVLSAAEALDWGLVTQVVADDDLLEQARSLANGLAQGSKASNAAIKRLLSVSGANSLADQLDLERDTIAQCADGKDGLEGVRSFVEKRPPVFD